VWAGAGVGVVIAFALFCGVQLLVNGTKAFFDFAGEAKTPLSDIISMTATAIGGLAIGGVAVMQYRKHKWAEYQVAHSTKLEEDTKTGERLSKAIEHLGNKEEHIRIGAIYELKRLAEDSERDRMAIGQILLKFIHSNTKDKKSFHEPEQDVETAMRILKHWAEVFEGVQARGMRLEGIWLNQADLEKANFWHARLSGAHLEFAYLKEANLKNTTLLGAHFWGTHLEGADLRGAVLKGILDTDEIKSLQTTHIDNNTRFDPGVREKYFPDFGK